MKKNKTALIYFSNTGTTKKIADRISELFSPDITEVKLNKPYGGFIPSVGRYIKNRFIHKEDQVETSPIDLTEYETVFIGSPVWAGKLPDSFADFLKKCKNDNLKIIPFATAAKTGKDSILEEIKEIFPDAEISDYFFQTQLGKEEPDEWLDHLKTIIND